MQTKLELEKWYDTEDPWGYRSNPEDIKRRKMIIDMLHRHMPSNGYQKAIDIGCGEGFITTQLPASSIHGIDLSDNALNRVPDNVIPVSIPNGLYDLVVSTGTLYPQYDHERINSYILSCRLHHVLIGGIKDWLLNYNYGKIIETIEFPYREFTQKLTLYEISA